MKFKRYWPLLALAAAYSQDQPVIKVGARLVEFSVIARDKNGPVSDLKKEDFTVLDQGHPRKIAVFHMESRQGDLENKPGALPPNVFSNRQKIEPNSTILLFDGINTRYSDQSYARLQIIKFIERLKPGDRIAIYSLGRELQIVHDFSSDVASLVEAAKALKVRISEGDERAAYNATDAQVASGMTGHFAALRGMFGNLTYVSSEGHLLNQVDGTDQALLAIARYFSSVPGRKSLVWVSSSFPIMLGDRFDRRNRFDSGIESASRALMDANVAVYPVDARGLMTNSNYGAANNTVNERQAQRGAIVPKVTVGSNEQASMSLIAERTGGKAFFNANDIQASIRRALDDSEVTYTIGFYLPQDEMDSQFHETKITVARKDVEIRTRKGYIAYEAAAQTDTSRDVVMRQVLFGSLDATALPVTVRVDRVAAQTNALQITSMLDPKSLIFNQADNQYLDTVDFVIAQQGADGGNLNVMAEVLHLSFTPERYKQIIGQEIRIGRAIELKPDAKMIRVMFYDRNSGLVGSARGPATVTQP